MNTTSNSRSALHHRALAAALTWLWTVGNRLGSSAPPDQKEANVRALLRRFPYWAHGNLALAEIAIDAENIALAYSSALSCLALQGGNSARSREALHIVGQCFLKRGDCDRALQYMLQAQELGLQTPRLAEDIAAAYILRGGYAEAYEILRQIPANKITAAGKAALSFARSKTTRPPD